MRARNIKPGFFKNEDLAEVDFATRLLFAGLWCAADREGRLEDRPKRLKIELFPGDSVDVDAMLETLAERGLIVRYIVDAARYLWIPTFLDHQKPHYNERPSVIPAYQPEQHALATKVASTCDQGDNRSALNPDCLIPDSSSYQKRCASRVERPDGTTDWTAAWIEARRVAGQPDPPTNERAAFGRNLKTITNPDPDVMQDAIRLMVERDKGGGVIACVYGDAARIAEQETMRVQTGGNRRVR